MEILVSNLSGNLRQAFVDNISYLIAPVTLLVEGVLNGSQGPIFYPAKDIEESVFLWNHMPLLNNHPESGSGRTPKVLEKTQVGHIYNTRLEGNSLRAEAWINIEKANRVDPRIVNQIQSGKKVEVSTGLNVSYEQNQGEYKGLPYKAIVHNYKPDHLAILLDTQGACSIEDGCGINNSHEEDPSSSSPNSEEQIKSLSKEQRTSIVDDLVTNCECLTEEDRTDLMNASDKVLTGYQKTLKVARTPQPQDHEEVLNSLKSGMTVGENIITLQEDGNLTITNASKTENEEEEEGEENMGKGKSKMEKNQQREITLQDLPKDLQEDIKFARNQRQKQKNDLVTKLVSSIENEAEQKSKADYFIKNFSTEQLEILVETLPKEESAPVNNNDYSGQWQAPVNNNRQELVDPLGQPDWDF